MSIFTLYEAENRRLNPFMGFRRSGKKVSGQAKKAEGYQGDRADQVTFDDLLVSVGISRNRDSFIRLFEYFAPRVKSFLMQGGFNPETADELAQETMLTVWDKADGFDPARAKASTWIFTIARNKKTDYLRKHKRPDLKAEDLAFNQTGEDAPDETLTRTQNNQALNEALAKLPEEQAALLRKSFFEDKTHEAIAEETKVPLGTVKSRIRLALERLRYYMGAQEQ